MKIAFDLDDTLIPTTVTFKCGVDRSVSIMRMIYKEPLRKGAKELLQELNKDHELWIYTTSLRTPKSIKLWLRSYGVIISGVINAEIHNQRIRGTGYAKYSKVPKLFGIDCLIDDSLGVQVECAEQNVKCIIIDPGDTEWVEKIRNSFVV